jgi:hypothetical protein
MNVLTVQWDSSAYTLLCYLPVTIRGLVGPSNWCEVVFLHWERPASRTFYSDTCVLPILNWKHVVMVLTRRIIPCQKLETEIYCWPQTFTVVSVILLLFFTPTGAAAFSSQFVPIHSPLISSIMDFVCSSDQTSQELIFHRLESPTVWTEWQVFPSRGWRLFIHSLWCVVARVRKSGVFLLLSILSILSIFFTPFRLGLYCVHPSTVVPTFKQRRFSMFRPLVILHR